MTDALFTRLHIIALTAALAVVCIFVSFPELDLLISGLFIDSQGRFMFAGFRAAILMNDTLRIGLTTVFTAICMIALAGRLLRLAPASGAGNWRFVVTSFVVGPGLIVNGVLKAWVGRARPVQISDFGGAKLFSPMLQLSDQCASNCSFSSGEVALTATFVFVALALVWPRLTRAASIAAALGGAALLCLSMILRVGMGRHFMSDAMASVAISAFVALGAYRVFDIGRERTKISLPALRTDLSGLVTLVARPLPYPEHQTATTGQQRPREKP